MQVKLDDFVKTLKANIAKLTAEEDIKTAIDGNRVIITIDKEEVRTKVVIPLPKTKKPSRLAPEFVLRVQEVRRRLKGQRDAIYLFTLLMSLHSELLKVKVGQLDKKCREYILPAMSTVEKDMAKLLEVK